MSTERGAVASIVAILLTFGVVLGFAALSIDVGSLMWERRQLQNGADAAALALAKTCAEVPAACDTTVPATSSQITNLNNWANYKDGAGGLDDSVYPAPPSGLAGVCGRGIATLQPCQPPTGALAECAPLPDNLVANTSIPYVEVHTRTSENGGTLLPTWLIRTVAGGSEGSTVTACARAAYGNSGGTSTLPLTFSMCEWRFNTSNGTDYYGADPVYGTGMNPDRGYDNNSATSPPNWPNTSKEVRVVMQDPPNNGAALDPTGCKNFNGHDVPGGFGYLEQSGCGAVVDQYNWAHVKPGNNLTSCDLSGKLGTVQYIPIFDCIVASEPTSAAVPSHCINGDGTTTEDSGHGSNTWYHIKGYAKFYLSGYKLSGNGSQTEASVLPGSTQNCSGPNRCLFGWFLDGELHDKPVMSPPAGPPTFGSYSIQPAG
jgi:hypothetical protein